jgi:hypothetical protein
MSLFVAHFDVADGEFTAVQSQASDQRAIGFWHLRQLAKSESDGATCGLPI